MTQAKDWDDFLQATAADPTPATFSLAPDESVENPDAHVQAVPFRKTAAALWMMVTGGGVGFILLVYGLGSYLGNTNKVVAVAPAGVDPFQDKPKTDNFLPKAEQSPSFPVAEKPAADKPAVGKKKPVVASKRVPPSVVYVPARQGPYSQRSYAPERAFRPVASAPPAPTPVRPFAPAALRPVAEVKPEPLPEAVSALYASVTEEGPDVDMGAENTVATVPTGSTKTDEAIAIYDGIDKTATEPVAISPAPKDAEAPLTAIEYSNKYPQEVEEESRQRLVARLAMIPADATIKGQTMAFLSWDANDSFPVGEEIRIKVRADFKNGETVIPKGSIAIAQSEKGTSGQFIMASVTRIETPSGKLFAIKPGMLTASMGDGMIEAKIKEPGQRGGAGRVLSRLGRSLLNVGVASMMPQGDSFGDRVIQSTAVEGLDSVNSALEPEQRSRRNAPTSFYLKPKTSIALVANEDIELTEVAR
jgi:hypothetical protein